MQIRVCSRVNGDPPQNLVQRPGRECSVGEVGGTRVVFWNIVSGELSEVSTIECEEGKREVHYSRKPQEVEQMKEESSVAAA